jgi:hypothetical protein
MPAFLLAGYSYMVGYLGEFGLSPSVVYFSFYDSVSASFNLGIMVFIELIKNLKWFYALIVISVMGLIFIGIISKFYNLEEKLSVYKVGPHAEKNRVFETTLNVVEYLNDWLKLGWFFCLVLPLVFVFLPLKLGFNDAKELDQKFTITNFCESLPSSNVSCVLVSDITGNEIFRGLFLTGTAQNIAVYDGKRNKVIPRSVDRIIEIYPADEE